MKTIEGFRLRPLGKEFIVVGEGPSQVDFNKMIALNESAAYLWKEVDGKDFTIQNLAGLLVERYGIELDRALKDSEAIAKKWIEAGIVSE
ncbi:MAG: PqqD family protein [Bacteroidales bacterium]|nr:PqqD family protein [Bacteroidales bacterium]